MRNGRGRRRALLAGVGAAVLVIAPARAAVAPPARVTVGPARAVSGPSPFAPGACGTDPVALATADPATGAELDPQVAVDPVDPRHIVVGWAQDPFGADAALSTLVAVTSDGGRTWTRHTLPGISRCTGGPRERATGISVGIGGDGTVYAATLGTGPYLAPGTPVEATAQVSRSRDGGRTWTAPVVVSDRGLEDMQRSLAVDPLRPSRAYLVWNRFAVPTGVQSAGSFFSATGDGGRSWSAPVAMDTPAPLRATVGNALSVLPDGTLVDVFTLVPASAVLDPSDPTPWTLMAVRSTDEGRTWSAPVAIADVPPTRPQTRDGEEIAAAPSVASPAVGPDGTLYVAWAANPSPQAGAIRVARSSDGGRTWTAASPVGDGGSPAFLPALAVTPDGTVGVLHDDLRDDVPGDGEATTDVWFSASRDRGRHWTETHLAGPFDLRRAPGVGSTAPGGPALLLGADEGLAATPSGFVATYAQAAPQAVDGPTDVFVSRIALASCLTGRGAVGGTGIGRVRLGAGKGSLGRFGIAPSRIGPRTYRFCIQGSAGHLTAVVGPTGRIGLVVTTARGPGGGVDVGATAAAVAHAFPHRRTRPGGLVLPSPDSTRVLGVLDGRVRFVAVADRALLHDEEALRGMLAEAGVRLPGRRTP